jgi:PhoH-like ATPase
MPLPPAPAKRAALLNTEGLDAEPTKSRHTRKTAPRAETRVTPERTSTKARSNPELTAPAAESMPAYKGDRKAAEPARAAAPKKKHTGPTKLFVLDTNVLMHDPMCLYRFEEHDVFLPMIVLEELDGQKRG